MKLFRFILIVLFVFAYISNSRAINFEADTLTPLKPLPKRKKPYPYQPIVIKTSPTALLYGGVFPLTSEYRLSIEMASTRTQSEQLSISLIQKNIIFFLFEKNQGTSTNQTLKVSGWRLQYAHKFYLVNRNHHAPYGFYVAPLVSYTNAQIALGLSRYYSQAYFDFHHFNFDLTMGVQVGKKDRLTLEIYWGAGYKKNTVYYHSSAFKITPYDTSDFGDFYNSNVHLLFGINLGISK